MAASSAPRADARPARGCRVGVDIGGTFTDLVLVTERGATYTRKVPSTPDDYGRAIAEGLERLLDDAGRGIGEIAEFLHGTTIGSNTILEMKGARIGLIGTEGFRDILEIRNLRMPRLYDITWEKPVPLVERYLRVTVPERIDATGAVLRPLDPGAARAAVRRLLDEGVEGIAVCLINSYVNDRHERMIAEAVRDLAPDLPLSLSVDVLPQIKEYERTSTTVVNAYIKPVVASYLGRLGETLGARGMTAPILLMQSNGGLTSARDACERPVNIVESGPAAGVVGAVRRAVEAGHPDIISFDMGGTTAKASLAEGGEVVLSQQYSVGGGIMVASRLLTGGGYLLGVPAIDVAEVGAGGGSIVRIDAGGAMKVGPESAGADPGPVCYGLGGENPTVTDANVLLGLINPNHLVGGELTLDAELARRQVEQRLARPLGIDVTAAAHGARQIAMSNMIRAIKAVSSERGRDPRRFTLFALGGNGALFACDMARELGVGTVLVPPSAGLFSAYGLLSAEVRHMVPETVSRLLRDIAPEDWEAAWQRLRARAGDRLRADGFAASQMRLERLASMRYKGQTFEIEIPVPDAPLTAETVARIETAFGDEHERTYGHRASFDEPVQVIGLKLAAEGRAGAKPMPGIATGRAGSAASLGRRPAYFGPRTGWRDTEILGRAALAEPREGPFIVEEYDTTCVVPPGCSARLDARDNIVIRLGPATAPGDREEQAGVLAD